PRRLGVGRFAARARRDLPPRRGLRRALLPLLRGHRLLPARRRGRRRRALRSDAHARAPSRRQRPPRPRARRARVPREAAALVGEAPRAAAARARLSLPTVARSGSVIRVLHVMADGARGGGGAHLQLLLPELRRRGIEGALLVGDG